MLWFKILLICVVLINGYVQAKHVEDKFEKYWKDVSKEFEETSVKYPYMALLGNKDKDGKIRWTCGGTLIHEKFVLTAGHCVNLEKNKRGVTLVRFMDHESKDYEVAKLTVHPEPTGGNDVGLIELKEKVSFKDGIRPIRFYMHKELPKDLVGVGWSILVKDKDMRYKLGDGEFVHMVLDECKEMYKKFKVFDIDEKMMCALKKEGDSCLMESGSPLLFKNEKGEKMLVGLTLLGAQCTVTEIPLVFSRVMTQLTWIESVVFDGK